jgi:inner membrane protein
MDTITHGIVGALAGKAFFAGEDTPASFGFGARSTALSSPTAKAAIVACTIGSMFPDIDVFAGPLARNPLAIMEWHRNITHSLVMLPVWSVLLAALSLPLARWLRWGAPPFAKLAGIYAVGLASHVLLDVATSFGTMMWSPLKYSRAAWDWIFILDFTFTTIALAPQLAAWCYREPAKFAWRAGAAWIVLSAGVMGVYKFAEAAGYAFPIWIVGIASAMLAALFFVPRIHGAGFHHTEGPRQKHQVPIRHAALHGPAGR